MVYQHLNSVLEAAVEDRRIATNPAKGVKLPERTEAEVVPPTMEAVQAICEAAAPWFRPAVLLGAGLGLRQAEASGLTVDRIDWLGRTVRIDRQWITRHKRSEWGPPKTKASVRKIPAASFVLTELGAHVGRRHDGPVLHRDGALVDHNAFAYYWRAAVLAAGLGRWVKDRETGRRRWEGMRHHALRHAFASLLIAGGCSVKAVQKALGHASAATTLNLYAHLWPGDDDRIRGGAVDRAFTSGSEDRLRTDREAE